MNKLVLSFLLFTTAAQAILDQNTNGLSDLWEKQYHNGTLFPITILATEDSDQDGWTNAIEAAAGTDPFNPNLPDGIIATTLTSSLTPGTYTLAWPTIIGKTYRLQASYDLLTWLNIGDPILGETTSHTLGINVIQPGIPTPPKLFWRIAASDLDSDNDGLTDSEENQLGTNPLCATTIPAVNDKWLATYFSETLINGGVGAISLNTDEDSDGSTAAEEYLDGTDPNQANDSSTQQWTIVHGDGLENIEKKRNKTLVVPAGQSAILIIAVASDEYPYYTDPESTDDFDDTIRWNITPANNPSIVNQIHVNDYHINWELAEINQQFLPNINNPVHYEVVQIITAPPEQNLSVGIEIAATNVGDGALPSHIVCGLLPLQVIVPSVDEDGNGIDGEYVVAKSLKVAKWENAFEGNNYSNGAVIDDFIAYDPDRFYVRVLNGAQIGVSSVEVETSDNPVATYNDNANEIDLQAAEDKTTVISDSMILVSNDHDDDYSASGAGNEDANNDRTHLVQLGGNFRVSAITIHGTKHQLNFKLPVPVRKVLEVNLIRMNVTGVPQQAAIENSVKFMNEYYAQLGLKITGVYKEKAWPSWEGRLEGYIDPFDEPENKYVGPLTQEYKTFIDMKDSEGNTDSGGINFYYIKIAYLNVLAFGVSVTSRQVLFENDINLKYTKKAFIFQTASLTGSTSSHELLHILAYDPDKEDDHQQKFFNLLAVENNSNTPVLWRKRIDLKQEQFIYLDPNVQNP